MAVTGDSSILVTAAGRLATRTVSRVDDIEPELRDFVRTSVRWLDPSFPHTGRRGQGQRGGWTDDDQVETEMTQFEELDHEGRGLRIIRLYKMSPPEGPFEGAVRVIALGAANGAKLELRWNFLASDLEVRGTSAELTVEGERRDEVVHDFQRWFDNIGN